MYVIQWRAPLFTTRERGRMYAVQPFGQRVWSLFRPGWTRPVHRCWWKYYFSSVASKHVSSGASTASMMNLCSTIMRVTSFTIHVESSPVAQRSSGFCKNSFDASVEKADWVIDYMRYGLDSVHDADNSGWWSYFEVLRANGQPTTTTQSEILRGHLSWSDWCVVTNINYCI